MAAGLFDVAHALQTARKYRSIGAHKKIFGVQAGEEETMLSVMKFQIILWGMAQLLRYAAWRHPACRRHDALLQHDQWRTGLRLCQGRQDHPHDADRL